jgi:hypothetical protein
VHSLIASYFPLWKFADLLTVLHETTRVPYIPAPGAP